MTKSKLALLNIVLARSDCSGVPTPPETTYSYNSLEQRKRAQLVLCCHGIEADQGQGQGKADVPVPT